jgi:hypothetical protein
MNKPYMTGVSTIAMIGTNKIIFCVDQSATMAVNYDFVILTYTKPFTFAIDEKDFDTNYSKELWYDNYYYTYKYSRKTNNMVIKIYEIKKNTTIKIIDIVDKKRSDDFQFGDSHTDKITLSNGDILFNNFGDVNSGLIFSRNIIKFDVHKKIKHSGLRKIANKILDKDLCYDCKTVDDFFESIKRNTKIIKQSVSDKYFC